jgi:hypothetical protein
LRALEKVLDMDVCVRKGVSAKNNMFHVAQSDVECMGLCLP